MTHPSSALSDSTALSRWLLAQHDERRLFEPLPRLPAAAGEAFIYDVQDGLNGARMRRGAVIAGYKIGLTTPVMQTLCHGDRPIAGVMFAGGIRRSAGGGVIRVRAGDFVRLGIESELAVRLRSALPAGRDAVTRADVAACVDEVAAAFELIEDRGAEYTTLDWRSMAADNSWHAGLVLGDPVPAARVAVALDTGCEGRLVIDGREPALKGSTRDVLGHPYDAVAWLANHLRGRGGPQLQGGQWISTGSIVAIRHATAGEHYTFSIDGLPSVSIAID